MVYAFLTFNINSSLVLFSLFYSPQGNDGSKPNRLNFLVSSLRQRILSVQSLSACSTAATTPPRTAYKPPGPLNTLASREKAEGSELHGSAFSTGQFRLRSGKLIPEDKFVVWKKHQNCVLALVCDAVENRVLAAAFLDHFVSLVEEELGSPFFQHPNHSELKFKPEELLALTHTYLPGGLLLFSTGNFGRHLHKKMESESLSKT